MSKLAFTTGGKECVPNAVQLLSKEFETDPVILFLLCSLSDKERLAYMNSYFHSLLTAAALNKAIFEEVNDWASCAVWMPPGYTVDNPMTYIQAGGLKILWKIGLKGCKRMLVEFQSQSNAAKKRGIAGRPRFYYLFFVGTRSDQRKQGLSSALIKRYQEVAGKEGLPIWLEATTSYSRQLYEKLGFNTVEVIVLGNGVVGSDGRPQVGGDGVKVWAMLWEPDATKQN